MIFQTSTWSDSIKELTSDPLWGYMRGIDLGFWIMAILGLWFFSLVLLHRASGQDMYDSQKWIFRSFAWYFFCTGGMYLFYILAYNIENYYNILLIAAYIMSILSTILVISTIEKYIVTKTRFMITILAAVIILIGVIFLFIAEQSPKLRIINQVAAPVLGVFVLGLYLMVIVKSTGDLRKRALFTLFGILVLLLGMFLDTESMMAILGSGPQLLLAPLSVIIGSIIIIQSQKQL